MMPGLTTWRCTPVPQRSIAIDSENVQADYEHGVLTLTIPVAEAAKPRRVQAATSTLL